MIVAVLDSSVVAAGIGWSGGSGRRVFTLLARRTWHSVRTTPLTAEWTDTVSNLAAHEPRWKNQNWPQWLDWLRRKSPLFEPSPLRPTVKRDPDDDCVLAAALGGRASHIVTYDKDLLSLGKPFGIQILRPDAFVTKVLKGD